MWNKWAPRSVVAITRPLWGWLCPNTEAGQGSTATATDMPRWSSSDGRRRTSTGEWYDVREGGGGREWGGGRGGSPRRPPSLLPLPSPHCLPPASPSASLSTLQRFQSSTEPPSVVAVTAQAPLLHTARLVTVAAAPPPPPPSPPPLPLPLSSSPKPPPALASALPASPPMDRPRCRRCPTPPSSRKRHCWVPNSTSNTVISAAVDARTMILPSRQIPTLPGALP